MRSLERKLAAELKMKEVLELAEVPPPDRVEYGEACVRFIWQKLKVVVVIDLVRPEN
jgi:hypothetical protein